MPHYNFACEKCEVVFEVQARMSEKDEVLSEPCPSCKKKGGIYQSLTQFPASVVRNKGRKVDGVLGEQLRSINKAYGNKSNIGTSVDLGTWT